MNISIKLSSCEGDQEAEEWTYRSLIGSLMYLTNSRYDLEHSIDLLSWSIEEYVFLFGSSPICWRSRKQQTTTLSTNEAEYMAMNSTICEGIWLQRLTEELTGEKMEPTLIKCDNTYAIALSKNPVFHNRSKFYIHKVQFHLREA